MVVVALLMWACRWLLAEFIPILEEAPTLLEFLGSAAPRVVQFFSGLLNYLTDRNLEDSISALQESVAAVSSSLADSMQAIVTVFDNEAEQVKADATYMDQVGGAIQSLGSDQWQMWDRLRRVIMPNTIQYVWDFVWTSWIAPLRRGLIATVNWCYAWHNYLQVFVINVQNYARTIQVWGRTWRATYVYPQLLFLLNPWRVAYWYCDAMLTGIVQYLNYEGHEHDRDGISRVVFQTLPTLWQVFDKYLAQWLQTDIAAYGWGASLPQFPPGSDDTPPVRPAGIWEPFVSEPSELTVPPDVPNVPTVDYNY